MFTRRTAIELGLTGWVRNLDDGRVEAVLQGSNDRINEALVLLKKGPAHGNVTELKRQEVSVAETFVGFEIKEDGETTWQNS